MARTIETDVTYRVAVRVTSVADAFRALGRALPAHIGVLQELQELLLSDEATAKAWIEHLAWTRVARHIARDLPEETEQAADRTRLALLRPLVGRLSPPAQFYFRRALAHPAWFSHHVDGVAFVWSFQPTVSDEPAGRPLAEVEPEEELQDERSYYEIAEEYEQGRFPDGSLATERDDSHLQVPLFRRN